MAAGAQHCIGCGKVRATGNEPSRYRCDGSCRRELDPPRYCARCGRRMAVQVTPNGWRGRCRGCSAEVHSA
jgi:hypothetical protein